MRILRTLLLLAATLAFAVPPAIAAPNDPLFINLTTDDPHRANMAITFGRNQLERGHPLTVFLNDRGVFVGTRAEAAKFGEHQKALSDLMAKGAVVLICPMCSKHYGIKDAEVLPGIKVGSPELTGGALFRDNTRALTW
jgi:sulfur relay (sulfurtransferase) complex TusBCD TusD component (DsrE family)